jgi:L-threonylcarbamoyladenylate synthase
VAASLPDAIDRAVRALRADGIVGLPTETVYGLAALPRDAALAALIAAKGRPPDKGIAVLIDDVGQAEPLVVLPAAARRLAARYWPGPLTLVLDLRPGVRLPAAVSGRSGRLGVRLPDHPVPRALARALGPLPVTSANRSGEPEARSAAELRERLGSAVALILDSGPVRGTGLPSTVVSVGSDGSLRVERVGAVDPRLVAVVAAGARTS